MLKLALFAVALLAPSNSAFAQACLHGPNEVASQRDRRAEALRLARQINTEEANQKRNGVFRPVSALNLSTPSGWDVRLVTDGEHYSFTLKDSTDSCGFVMVSDENGIIYEGMPIGKTPRQSELPKQ